ncbi:MAG: WD40 repeat domain-containing protein [Gemmataceae bacterium]
MSRPLLVALFGLSIALIARAEPPTDINGDPLPRGAVLRLGETRFRPGGLTRFLAFSPDGKQLASLSNSMYRHDRLSIWDTATGRELRSMQVDERVVEALAWARDGRGFVVLGTGSGFQVLEFTDPKTILPYTPARGSVGQVGIGIGGGPQPESFRYFAVDPDGRRLVVWRTGGASPTPTTELFELNASQSHRELKKMASLGAPAETKRLLFTPDGESVLAFGSTDKNLTVTRWDIAANMAREAIPLPAAEQQGQTIAVSADGRAVAVGGPDGTVRLAELETGKELLAAHIHDGPKHGRPWSGVSAVTFVNGGKAVFSAGRDDTQSVWDAATGREIAALNGHHSWVECIAQSRDGKLIATSGQDGLIRLWDGTTFKPLVPPRGHFYAIWDLDVSGDGRRAVTAGGDLMARVWDLATGREERSVARKWFGCPALSPDGQSVLVPGGDGIQTYNVATGRAAAVPGDIARAKARGIQFAPDGRTVLTAHDQTVSLWDWPAGKLRHTFGTNGEYYGATFGPDSRMVLTHSKVVTANNEGGMPELWDVATGKKLCSLDAMTNFYPRMTAIHPDGQRAFVFERRESKVVVFNLVNRQRERAFVSSRAQANMGLYYSVLSLALSPDGRMLAIGNNDGSITLFETATGQIRKQLVGHREACLALGFASTRRLVSGSSDHTGLVWDVSLTALAADTMPAGVPLVELWEKLDTATAAEALPLLTAFLAKPNETMRFLAGRLKPPPVAGDAELDRIFADLGSPTFATREKAAKSLAELGEAAVPGVKARIAGGVAAEVKNRADDFLRRFDGPEVRPDRVREQRAFEVIEAIDSPAGRELLRKLAAGPAGAWRTDEAKRALARLEKSR